MLQSLLVQVADHSEAVSLGTFVDLNDLSGAATLSLIGDLLTYGCHELPLGNGDVSTIRRFGG